MFKMFGSGVASLSLLSLTAALFWSSLYFAVRLVTQERPYEFSNRLVTFVHGLLIAVYGCHECFADGWAFSHTNTKSTEFQTTILITSLGYFIFDLAWCLYHQTETKLILAHHIYSIFAIFRLVNRGYNGNQAACALGGMELTNPLLQGRWFIRAYGYHKTKLFRVVEATFIVVFFLVRILLGTLIGIYVMLSTKHDWEFKGLAILIYIVSWVFTVNMYHYLQRKYMQSELGEDVSVHTTQSTVTTATTGE